MYNVFDKMTAHYNAMSKANRKIANYIFRNKDSIHYMSITKLAEGSGVAVATVTRFCRDLGFSSFNAFRLEMAKAQNARTIAIEAAEKAAGGEGAEEGDGEESAFDGFLTRLYKQYADALWKTKEMLREEEVEKAVAILMGAKRVFLVGRGGGYVAAKAASFRFLGISTKFICVEDQYAEAIYASQGGAGDVILCLSYTGAHRSGTGVLRMAKERGIRIVLVTHFVNSPEAALADAVLLCGGIEDPEQSLELNVKSSQMFVIDVLFRKYCEADGARAAEYQIQVAETLKEKVL